MQRALVTALVMMTLGCGSNSPTSPSGTGATFNLMLRDSPFSDAKAVLVTFSQVTAHRASDADFTTLPFAGGAPSRTCDLKKLQGAQEVLGTGTLPAAHYTMIRLVMSGATIYFDNPSTGTACAPSISAPSGQNAALDIPSGEVRLNRSFDVPASGTTTMVLDFNGDQSIRQMGNGRFSMTPVITVVSVQ